MISIERIAVYVAIAIGVAAFFKLPRSIGFVNRILISLVMVLILVLGIIFLSVIIGIIIIFVLIILLFALLNKRRFRF